MINVIQYSSLRLKKAQSWYETPFVKTFTLRVKKSTLIILALIIYILWSHIAQAAPVGSKTVPTYKIMHTAVGSTPTGIPSSILGTPPTSPSLAYIQSISAVNKAKKDAEAAQEAARQAEIEREAILASQSTSLSTQPVYASSCGDAKSCIYDRESSGRLDAVNSSGCIGLGQSCGGGLANACPNWQTDYNCQDAFWDNYAVSRYGSWEASWQFWLNNHWW